MPDHTPNDTPTESLRSPHRALRQVAPMPSSHPSRRLAALALLALAPLAGCGGDDDAPTEPAEGRPAVAFELAQAPGNLTITPEGRRVTSLHQFYAPVRVLAEVTGGGRLTNFPVPGEGALQAGLTAVLGIRSDTAGVLWMLDNGNAGKAPSKIVAYDTRAGSVQRTIALAAPVVDTNSFINDLAFDYQRNHLYVADPAGPTNSALIVVNLATNSARRVLQGHPSVVPENVPVVVEGKSPTRRMPNGALMPVRIGVDGIGIDYAREWVYYGPLTGTSMYRVRAADLANPALTAAQLAARVERYATKPPSDGITLDSAGNIYLGDLPANAIGVIGTDRSYRQIAQGEQLKWMDDFEWGPNGELYAVSTQLHLSPELNAGVNESRPPFRVFRVQPLAAGRQGF